MNTSTVAFASLLALAGTAHAEKVGIVVTGESTLQPQVASQLERWLHDRGRTIVPGALEPDAINTLIDCFVLEDLRCARGVVDARSNARALVFTRVEQSRGQDGSREISVTSYYFQKNAEPISERRVCSQCTDAKLIETIDDMMLTLVHLPPAGEGHPEEDAAPAPAPVAAPAPSVATESGSSKPGLVPYALIGVGGAALVAGGIMFAIDEDPDPSDTTSKTYRDTGTAGVVLGVVGAAALGAGLYLYFTGKHDSHPVAAASHDGGFVGWTGRF